MMLFTHNLSQNAGSFTVRTLSLLASIVIFAKATNAFALKATDSRGI